MKIIRFETQAGRILFGSDYDGKTASVIRGAPDTGFECTSERKKVEKLLSPVVPPAILCIGLNYRLHAKETGLALPKQPVVFMKSPNAIISYKDDIQIPIVCQQKPEVDYEAELGVIIGRAAKNVSEQDALHHVFGYVGANDISARRWQKHGGAGQWVRSKSFDTFCPTGPYILTADELDDPQDLSVESRLNGKIMQNSNTSDMIFPVATLIAYLSKSTTLMPGTLILTGTPEGVGFIRQPPVYLKAGDRLETRIEHLGVLENRITLEKKQAVETDTTA
ncbi:MAG: 5-carboxymethyl-2-hydroxymuconate isomerase [Desulfobacterales bacterium]|nr:MAG: 5-carboxymethyl-2-hydroxymuconate isomerase [Desulfobacterales bacterium]